MLLIKGTYRSTFVFLIKLKDHNLCRESDRKRQLWLAHTASTIFRPGASLTSQMIYISFVILRRTPDFNRPHASYWNNPPCLADTL